MAGKNYIIIKHKNITPKLVEAEYDKEFVSKTTASLSNVLTDNNISTNASKPFEGMLKLASNNSPKNILGSVTKSFEDIISTGKITNKVAELALLKYQTPLLRLMASYAGYSSFTALYDKIKTGGTGLTDEEITSLVEAAQRAGDDKYSQISINLNEKKADKTKVDGLPINVVQSIEDTFESEVPLKKVEAGFDIANYVYNQNPTYSFTGFIADGIFSETGTALSVENIKEELINIRDSKITFDIEFSEEINNSTGLSRTRKPLVNCLFTSLSFSRSQENSNGYDISFDIIPIKKGKVEAIEEKFTGTAKTNTSGTSTGSKLAKTTTNTTGNTKSSNTDKKQSVSKDVNNKPNYKTPATQIFDFIGNIGK